LEITARSERAATAIIALSLLLGAGADSTSGGPSRAMNSSLPERAKYVDFRDHLAGLYRDAGLEENLGYEVFEVAMIGYYNLVSKHLVPRDSIITVIDYTRPSADERLVVIDVETREMLHRSFVAHGMNSGEDCAESFSNVPGSLQTSLGFYVTGEEYVGVHGGAMKLKGVDTTFNDKAEERCIVVHGAWYCTDDFVEEYGRLGRSWGCPVLPPDVSGEIIDTIKDGTCLFAFFNDDDYLEHSEHLDIDIAVEEFTRRERMRW
jgi:hypothetical protein